MPKKNQSNRINIVELKVQKIVDHERKWTLELRIQKNTNTQKCNIGINNAKTIEKDDDAKRCCNYNIYLQM
jgi:hypothetical protein